MSTIIHDPQARLDYVWDWTPWLADGETITAATVTSSTVPDTALIVEQPPTVVDGAKAIAWISGGTPERTYRVACHITTSSARQDTRTHRLYVAAR